jgi:hypothetical protein
MDVLLEKIFETVIFPNIYYIIKKNDFKNIYYTYDILILKMVFTNTIETENKIKSANKIEPVDRLKSINKIGLVVTINNNINNITKHFTCITLEQCYQELLECLVQEFKQFKNDYPMTLDDFNILWFDKIFEYYGDFDYDCFTYSIFNNNEWIEPWNKDDIYNDLLDKLIIKDIEMGFKIESDNDTDESDCYNKYKDMDFYR